MLANVFQIYKGLTLMTEYIHPPITTRSYDWRAYIDEYEDETNPYEAWAPTQELAVSKLLNFIDTGEEPD